MEEEYRFKVILLGNIDVGKTSLILRFSDGRFTETIKTEIDQRIKDIQIDGKAVKIIIADTAGQERFRTLTSSFYRNADAMILVYDITNPTSFKEVEEHYSEGLRYSQRSYKILVGNKLDLDSQRTITSDTGKELAMKSNIPYFETSAKDGTNVDDIFVHVAQFLIDNGGSQLSKNGVVKLATNPPGTSEKKKKICNAM